MTKMLSPSKIQAFKAQPMPMPSGNIFYMNYSYGLSMTFSLAPGWPWTVPGAKVIGIGSRDLGEITVQFLIVALKDTDAILMGSDSSILTVSASSIRRSE